MSECHVMEAAFLSRADQTSFSSDTFLSLFGGNSTVHEDHEVKAPATQPKQKKKDGWVDASNKFETMNTLNIEEC